jgi:hypothetical protein
VPNDTTNNTQYGTTIELSQEQAESALQTLSAINLDEVELEIIAVKVRGYRNVEVTDDEGQPVPGPDGKPLTYRKPFTRMAHIQNFVPLPLYYQFIDMQGKFAGMSTTEQTRLMTTFVLEVWQLSEPFMDERMLGESVDLPVIGALFRRFFDQSRLNRG